MIKNERQFLPQSSINIEELYSKRPFERIFHSSAARLLDFFLIFREYDYSESDIARKTNLSPKTVSKELELLLNEGLVKITRKRGKSNMYKWNETKKTEGLLQYVDYIDKTTLEEIKVNPVL